MAAPCPKKPMNQRGGQERQRHPIDAQEHRWKSPRPGASRPTTRTSQPPKRPMKRPAITPAVTDVGPGMPKIRPVASDDMLQMNVIRKIMVGSATKITRSARLPHFTVGRGRMRAEARDASGQRAFGDRGGEQRQRGGDRHRAGEAL